VASSDPQIRPAPIGIVLVVVSAVAYGTVPIVAKLAFGSGVALPLFLSWRFSLAALALWAVVPLSGGSTLSRRRIAGLLAMGAIGYAGQSAAFFAALQRMPAAATALLLYTYPAMVTIGAGTVLRERIDDRKIVAVIIAFAGCSLVVQGQAGGLSPTGVGFALLSAAVYSAYILFGSRLFAGAAPVASSALVMTATAATFVVAAVARTGLSVPSSAAQFGWILLAATLGTALPVLAFLSGMPRIGASRASIISTLEPVVTVALAGVVLAQPLGPMQIAGAICILSSVAVLESGRGSGPAQV
jgi:drug/metabolite transporter (DMT)-like permease